MGVQCGTTIFISDSLPAHVFPCYFSQQKNSPFKHSISSDFQELKMTTRKKVNYTTREDFHKKEEEQQAFRLSNSCNYEKCDEDSHFIALLKVCAKQKDLRRGSRIHRDLAEQGLLEKNVYICSSLISMYAKCGALLKAQEVFEYFRFRNGIAWNAIITGYTQHGYGEKALKYFERMLCEGMCPDIVTYLCVLKACGSIKAADKGQEIHATIVGEGNMLVNNPMVGTALVDMYAKCGLLGKSQEIFDKLSVRDVVAWSAIITAYAQHGNGVEALKRFEQMQREGVSPNAITFVSVLKACGSIGASYTGQEIHAKIASEGFLRKDIVLGTALIDMYGKCGLLEKAQEVFDQLPSRDVISWSALIAGYTQFGYDTEALDCFEQMKREGVSPNAVTFASILKACGNQGILDKGQEIHLEIVRDGLLEKDVMVGNALLDMYGKCGALAKAQEVFGNLSVRDVVSWNALISGYVRNGETEQAYKCFEHMQHKGYEPNESTFSCILKACGRIEDLSKGQEIHAEIIRRGLLANDTALGNALIDMYGKCGALPKAREVFDNLQVRNVITWGAIIAGCVQHGYAQEALHLFERMRFDEISPDAVTLACVLKSCGCVGALCKGQEIHAEMVKDGLLEVDIVVDNALIDMYGSCGMLMEATEVFDKMNVRDVVSWTSLISGFSHLGKEYMVFKLVGNLINEGKIPDLATFTILLNLCSHSGLLDKGEIYFECISEVYGIMPTLEHHACMIDLFGRAGHLDKVISIIKQMPYIANMSIWHSVLGACQKWGNVKVARLAFEHALQIDEMDATAYVCLSNLYATCGMKEDAEKINALREEKGAWKTSKTWSFQCIDCG